jgi:hypothetical protein
MSVLFLPCPSQCANQTRLPSIQLNSKKEGLNQAKGCFEHHPHDLTRRFNIDATLNRMFTRITCLLESHNDLVKQSSNDSIHLQIQHQCQWSNL